MVNRHENCRTEEESNEVREKMKNAWVIGVIIGVIVLGIMRPVMACDCPWTDESNCPAPPAIGVECGWDTDHPCSTYHVELSPKDVTNILPDQSSHELTVTVYRTYENYPPECQYVVSGTVYLTTDFGAFLDGNQTYSVEINDGCEVSTNISSAVNGTAHIDACFAGVCDTATKTWAYPPDCGAGQSKCVSGQYFECSGGQYVRNEVNDSLCIPLVPESSSAPASTPTQGLPSTPTQGLPSPRTHHYSYSTSYSSSSYGSPLTVCGEVNCLVEGKGCIECPDGETCQKIEGTIYGNCVPDAVPAAVPITQELPPPKDIPLPAYAPWLVVLMALLFVGGGTLAEVYRRKR